MERKALNFHETQEKVWIVQQNQDGQSAHNFIGVAVSDVGATQLPGLDHSKPFVSTLTTLYRPSLKPIYGGPTLTEALWNEMDRLMEGLMTGQEAEGDRFRAAELAWVLAIVANPYEPSVDAIRAETVERWNAAKEADQ